ncbi:MAG TPA: UDP-N-acetylglucosamine 2-epimerase (non-hydrolyzing), partial [Isosphaeraceae bacterium]|nr:UDP-N-acetylglucosamine 2-epimerase (non-hydrolyzing) [Isosphaeraceae bacterium]
GLMTAGQSLVELTARAVTALDRAFRELRPDLVLAQGDTTSVFASALAAHYGQIPFAHVEAGLRTGDRQHPFPEETNRILTSHLASLHFAPTESNRQALLNEGVEPGSIHVVGNTIVDALLSILDRHEPPAVPEGVRRFVLVTTHRRESFGEPLNDICRAVLKLVLAHRDLHVLFPVHPNPSVRETVSKHLAGQSHVHLLDPLPYPSFVALLRAASLALSDSGGVQEEAPSLGTPLLVLRQRTERPEALETGLVRLVGTSTEVILEAAEAFLNDPPPKPSRLPAPNPYGDGKASERIADCLRDFLRVEGKAHAKTQRVNRKEKT